MDDLNEMFGGGGFSDFFQTIFGMGGRQSSRSQPQGYQQEADITLEEAYKGTTRLTETNGKQKRVRIPAGVRTDEWCGTSLATVFAQPRNLLRPSFLRMLRDVVRFNRQAPRWIDAGMDAPTLRELFARGGYSRAFLDHYLLPM